MEFHKENAQIFVPDGQPSDRALARTTHLAIAAHQDDIEIMAVDGILKCYQKSDRWFSGVVVTDGAGSPRDEAYRDYTDEEMRRVRAKEQIQAAQLGEYSAQILLDYSSAEVRDGSHRNTVDDFAAIIKATRPRIIYTHNLADKHPTHVAVAVRTIAALRTLSPHQKPEMLVGCEAWRDLDWMVDEEKVVFDCSSRETLQESLLAVFDSQITGGKRYDLATMGRRTANATYFSSHEIDDATGLAYAMDLTPLLVNSEASIRDFVRGYIDRFAQDVDSLITGVL